MAVMFQRVTLGYILLYGSPLLSLWLGIRGLLHPSGTSPSVQKVKPVVEATMTKRIQPCRLVIVHKQVNPVNLGANAVPLHPTDPTYRICMRSSIFFPSHPVPARDV
jgi:hypothetical protein